MVGGGCRGLALARALVVDGHAVRAVTRHETSRARIEQAGAECWIGDPAVIGTLRYALDNVTVLLWLLGRVEEPALHGSRLQMMLERTTDTTVRGVVYERGTEDGLRELERARALNEIPFQVIDADGADEHAWLVAAQAAIASLLAPGSGRLAVRT
jgi:hypothetical protein